MGQDVHARFVLEAHHNHDLGLCGPGSGGLCFVDVWQHLAGLHHVNLGAHVELGSIGGRLTVQSGKEMSSGIY